MTPGRLRAVVTLALSLVLVGLTGEVERPSAEVAVYNHECRTPEGGPCLEPREAAGLPVPFVFDTPGISVEHSVSIVEDESRAAPFVLNVVLVWAAIWAAWASATRRRTPGGWSPRRAWRGAAFGGALALAVMLGAVAGRAWAPEGVAGRAAWVVLYPVLAAAWPLGAFAWVAVGALVAGVGAAAALAEAALRRRRKGAPGEPPRRPPPAGPSRRRGAW